MKIFGLLCKLYEFECLSFHTSLKCCCYNFNASFTNSLRSENRIGFWINLSILASLYSGWFSKSLVSNAVIKNIFTFVFNSLIFLASCKPDRLGILKSVMIRECLSGVCLKYYKAKVGSVKEKAIWPSWSKNVLNNVASSPSSSTTIIEQADGIINLFFPRLFNLI